jgi:hypothetical protein
MKKTSEEYPPPDKVILEDHDEEVASASLTESPSRVKKKRDNTSLRKAPQAPKRFKSSYICFFMAKQPEIKGELGDKSTVTEISKRSAEMWYVFCCDEKVWEVIHMMKDLIFSRLIVMQEESPARRAGTLGRCRCQGQAAIHDREGFLHWAVASALEACQERPISAKAPDVCIFVFLTRPA